MIDSNRYPQREEFKLSYSVSLTSMDECIKILQKKANGDYSKYPIVIETDIHNKKYEVTAWMESKAQKAICENDGGAVTGTQLIAMYTYR